MENAVSSSLVLNKDLESRERTNNHDSEMTRLDPVGHF